MANTKEFYYRSGAVNGSVAYDFNNPELFPDYGVPEREAQPRPEAPARERANPQTETGVRTRAVPRAKQSMAPMALVGYACAAVLLVFALMAQVQLMDVTGETVEMETRLSELKLEQAKLLIAYESAFNLTEIEDYAIVQLGMQKPHSDQVFYMDNAAPDKGVVLTPSSDSSRIARAFSDTWEMIKDFFAK